MNDDELAGLFKQLAETSPAGPTFGNVVQRRRKRRLTAGAAGAVGAVVAVVAVGLGTGGVLLGGGGSHRAAPVAAHEVPVLVASSAPAPAPASAPARAVASPSRRPAQHSAVVTSAAPSPYVPPSPVAPSPSSADTLAASTTTTLRASSADGRAGDITSLSLTVASYGSRVARIIWGDGSTEVRRSPSTCATPSPEATPSGSPILAAGTATSAKAPASRPLTVHAAHHWTTPGTYHVRIVLTDDCGHTTTVTKVVRISPRSAAP